MKLRLYLSFSKQEIVNTRIKFVQKNILSRSSSLTFSSLLYMFSEFFSSSKEDRSSCDSSGKQADIVHKD